MQSLSLLTIPTAIFNLIHVLAGLFQHPLQIAGEDESVIESTSNLDIPWTRKLMQEM